MESLIFDVILISYVTPIAKTNRDVIGFTNLNSMIPHWRFQYYLTAVLITASLYSSIFSCTMLCSTLTK